MGVAGDNFQPGLTRPPPTNKESRSHLSSCSDGDQRSPPVPVWADIFYVSSARLFVMSDPIRLHHEADKRGFVMYL